MIDRMDVNAVIPSWGALPANRYMSHPSLRTAVIQMLDEPGVVYVVSDEALPRDNEEAKAMVIKWREAHDVSSG